MFEVVLTMFVVLFAFLAGGLWIGWTLAVTGTVLLAIFHPMHVCIELMVQRKNSRPPLVLSART